MLSGRITSARVVGTLFSIDPAMSVIIAALILRQTITAVAVIVGTLLGIACAWVRGRGFGDTLAPRWLPGGHLQTIWPALFSRHSAGAPPVFLRERWTAPDGDFIDVDFMARVGGDAAAGAAGATEARALLGEYQRYAAYSNAQAAWGRLYNSVGLDILPATVEDHDVKTLAAAMQDTMAQWQKTVFQANAQ